MESTPFLDPKFFDINLSYIVNKPVLIVIFFIYTILYFILSSVLFYHWANYGMRSSGILFGRSLFIFVSIFMLVVAGFSIYYF